MESCDLHDITFEGYFNCPVCVANNQLRELKAELQAVIKHYRGFERDDDEELDDIQAILNNPRYWSTQ